MGKKKSKKFRGKRTHGYGSKKKHRGKGSKGGKGYAGSKKHKRIGLRKCEPEHFKKKKLKSRKKPNRVINVKDLDKMGKKEINLNKSNIDKLLGKGEINKAVTVKVKYYSKKAKEKIEEAGGKIVSE